MKNIKNSDQNQLFKKTSVLTNRTNSFSIPALNPTELKKNPIIIDEDFSYFEEKPDFKKSLDKAIKINQQDQNSPIDKRPISRKNTNPIKSTSPLLKRTLTSKYDRKHVSPQKRKSEAFFRENSKGHEQKNDMPIFNINNTNVINSPLGQISNQNNFNITITKINNNIVLPYGTNYNVNVFQPPNEANPENIIKVEENNRLLTPEAPKKHIEERIFIEDRRSLNILPGKQNIMENSLELVKRQCSIQPKTNSLVKKKTDCPTELTDLKMPLHKKRKDSVKDIKRFSDEYDPNDFDNVIIVKNYLNIFPRLLKILI